MALKNYGDEEYSRLTSKDIVLALDAFDEDEKKFWQIARKSGGKKSRTIFLERKNKRYDAKAIVRYALYVRYNLKGLSFYSNSEYKFAPFLRDRSKSEELYKVVIITPISKDFINRKLRKLRSEASKELDEASDLETAIETVLRQVVKREGQPSFRKALIDKYKQCVVTKCDAEAALEAAHIVPYAGKRSSVLANGLLLRADIHTLFDKNLLKIDPQNLTIVLSEEIQNSEYKKYQGKKLVLVDECREYLAKRAIGEFI